MIVPCRLFLRGMLWSGALLFSGLLPAASISFSPLNETTDNAALAFRADLGSVRKSVWYQRFSKNKESFFNEWETKIRNCSGSGKKDFTDATLYCYGRGEEPEGFVLQGFLTPKELAENAAKSTLSLQKRPGGDYLFRTNESIADDRKTFLIRAIAPDTLTVRAQKTATYPRTGQAPVLALFRNIPSNATFSFAATAAGLEKSMGIAGAAGVLKERALEGILGWLTLTGKNGAGISAEIQVFCRNEAAAKALALELRQGVFLALATVSDPRIDPAKLLSCVRVENRKKSAVLTLKIDAATAEVLYQSVSSLLQSHTVEPDAPLSGKPHLEPLR
ncbi:MAG: hypothetical protein PHS41_09565 [Victivallaceae bacterium]|nr:hypothetical protein [Victivallaceae bacterium]